MIQTNRYSIQMVGDETRWLQIVTSLGFQVCGLEVLGAGTFGDPVDPRNKPQGLTVHWVLSVV